MATQYRKAAQYRKTQLYQGGAVAPPAPGGVELIGYRVALANRGTTGLGTVIYNDLFTQIGVPEAGPHLRWMDELNAVGTCEFELPIDAPEVTTANFQLANREIHVYREDSTGEKLVWAGRLLVADVEGWFVRFKAEGWYWGLTRREINTDQVLNADQFSIIRTLVDQTQALTDGSLGLTHYDTTLSGVQRKLTLCSDERRPISDVMEDFADRDNGLDFQILPDKRLRLFSPRRGTTPGVTFSGESTASDISYQSDATDLTTTYTALGNKEECSRPLLATATDVTARGTFGLLHSSEELDGEPNESELQDEADEQIRIRKEARFQPHVTLNTQLPLTPSFYSYDVGDTVTLTATRGAAGGFGNFSRTFRVLAREVFLNNPGIEEISLDLDAVVT